MFSIMALKIGSEGDKISRKKTGEAFYTKNFRFWNFFGNFENYEIF